MKQWNKAQLLQLEMCAELLNVNLVWTYATQMLHQG